MIRIITCLLKEVPNQKVAAEFLNVGSSTASKYLISGKLLNGQYYLTRKE
jgi:hypothetical protein